MFLCDRRCGVKSFNSILSIANIRHSKFPQEVLNYFGAGISGAFLAGFIIFAILFGILIYVYTSLAWSEIGRKLKYKKRWLAWIPIARWSMILQMGESYFLPTVTSIIFSEVAICIHILV